MLTVAMSDPLNVLAIDDIKTLTGYDVIPVVSTLSEITTAIDRIYHPEQEIKKTICLYCCLQRAGLAPGSFSAGQKRLRNNPI